MNCSACKEDFTGAPVLVPNLKHRRPLTFCGRGACKIPMLARARAVWPLIATARKTPARRGS